MNKKEVASLMVVLTLLIAPEAPARNQTCQVLSAMGGRVILQCPERQNLQTDDWVRLHAVRKKVGEGCCRSQPDLSTSNF